MARCHHFTALVRGVPKHDLPAERRARPRAGKAAVLQEILEGPLRPDTLPAQIVRPADGTLLWMVDREAAALLKEKGRKNT